ncbi:hypothetical protein [Streptomyces broussonetiae]|uniref:hypothetical protein n=1 Tax=Streptomyces broussonetiae TaxID=2686304 RepID=UPI0035D8F714
MRGVAGEEDPPGPVPVSDAVGEMPLAVAEQFHGGVEGQRVVDQLQWTGAVGVVRGHHQVVQVTAVQRAHREGRRFRAAGDGPGTA